MRSSSALIERPAVLSRPQTPEGRRQEKELRTSESGPKAGPEPRPFPRKSIGLFAKRVAAARTMQQIHA